MLLQTSSTDFSKELEIITGIRFTPREIDIIACTVNAKGTKTIASLLAISPKTVETHIRIIMGKLACNSRENIVEFIEKSGTFLLFRKYYQELLNQAPIEFLQQQATDLKNSSLSKFRNVNILSSYMLTFINFKKIMLALIVCILIMLLIWMNKSYRFSEENVIRSNLLLPAEAVFLKRSEILDQMEKKFSGKEETQAVVLVGMGGAGKSILARHFASLQKADVVWEMNAETKASLANSFKELAYILAQTKEQKELLNFIQTIQEPEERERQIVSFVKQIIKGKKRWLLLYDNVESMSDIKEYFPYDSKAWGAGRVIITTRDSNIKNSSYITPENIFFIEELNSYKSLILFSKILYGCSPEKLSTDQQKQAISFLKHIPPFPLDISTAAYYIKNSQISFDQYLKRISQYDKSFKSAQQTLLKEVSDYTNTRYGIVRSSLEKIININPAFKELLLFVCLFDSQNIPKELLNFYNGNTNIDTFLYSLKKYSLITNETCDTFSLHRSTKTFSQLILLDLFDKTNKNFLVEKIITAIEQFYEFYSKNHQENLILLIPHLEYLINNLNKLNLPKNVKEKQRKNLLLLTGYIHRKGSNNLIIAKKYLTHAYTLDIQVPHLKKGRLALLLKDLGSTCAILTDYDECIFYCKESIKICEKIPSSAALIAENLRLMAWSYGDKNDLESAKACLEEALKKLSSLDKEVKQEIESDIYLTLAYIYSSIFLNRNKALKSEEYVLKSLNILNSSELFSTKASLNTGKNTCQVIKTRVMLGRVYNRFGRYQEAMKLGFEEAEYIIKKCGKNCCNDLLRDAHILLGKAEALLRLGQLKDAERNLTKCIDIRSGLLGEAKTLNLKSYRAEARIRLGKFNEAYEDCKFVLNHPPRIKNNYFYLLYLTCFYHAAVIKYKENNLVESGKYFAKFFKDITKFCKTFLDEKEYLYLEAKGVFDNPYDNNKQQDYDVKQFLYNSAIIFSAIYGPHHPFVHDYIQKNVVFKKA